MDLQLVDRRGPESVAGREDDAGRQSFSLIIIRQFRAGSRLAYAIDAQDQDYAHGSSSRLNARFLSVAGENCLQLELDRRVLGEPLRPACGLQLVGDRERERCPEISFDQEIRELIEQAFVGRFHVGIES